METKTHYVVTFVSLIFLGVIVVKPESLIRKDDRICKIEKGRMDCHYRQVNYSIIGANAKIKSDDGINN